MKIQKLIDELQRIKDAYGDIEVQLQELQAGPGAGSTKIVDFEQFFIVPELYEGDDGTICNLRTWPY